MGEKLNKAAQEHDRQREFVNQMWLAGFSIIDAKGALWQRYGKAWVPQYVHMLWALRQEQMAASDEATRRRMERS